MGMAELEMEETAAMLGDQADQADQAELGKVTGGHISLSVRQL